MAAKFSAFEFASEEFNSDLAQLVNGFTQNLLRLIQEECVRKGNESDGPGSNSSSPLTSPTGKAPRKKAPTSKRGRPSKEETDVEIEPVSDLRSVSEDLLGRAELVRSSSKSPRSSDIPAEAMESVAVNLDDLITSAPISEEPVKKGKGKATKEPKEKKEKVVKEPKEKKEKVVKEPKEKKDKVVKEPKEKKEKVVKEPKEKKEKVVKEPKEKKEKVVKEPKAKKGKKGEVLAESDVDVTNPPLASIPEAVNEVVVEDDDDEMNVEVCSSEEKAATLSKIMAIATVLSQSAELDEEDNFAKSQLLDKLEQIINSQGSGDDDIVSGQGDAVDDIENEIEIADEFSEKGDDDLQADSDKDDDDEDADKDNTEGDEDGEGDEL